MDSQKKVQRLYYLFYSKYKYYFAANKLHVTIGRSNVINDNNFVITFIFYYILIFVLATFLSITPELLNSKQQSRTILFIGYVVC